MSDRKLDEDQKNVLKLARAFEPMVRSEGWHFYMQIVEGHLKAHMEGIISPTVDIAGVLQGERDKGAVVGLRLVKNIVSSVIEQAAEIRKDIGDNPDDD